MNSVNSGNGASPLAAIPREDTIVRLGDPGCGDNWPMTWTDDDRHLTSLCDGFGWHEPRGPFHNTTILEITGGPEKASFEPLPSFPSIDYDFADLRTWNRYYGFSILAIDEFIYLLLSTPRRSWVGEGPTQFAGAKLIYSPDRGATWCNQDGSSPVVLEDWNERNSENMAFFDIEGNAFALPTFIQMGKNYEANKDGFVYLYAPNGAEEGTMNQLVMSRVPTGRVLESEAYEYFAGPGPDGEGEWKGIDDRRPILEFPSGWVNTLGMTPLAWQTNVVYNEPLGVYMLISSGMGCGPNGEWFSKPSYLGIWLADTPWGPWRQIHEDAAWTPGGDEAARCYAPQISPRWIAEDGRSFWIVWSDYQSSQDSDSDEDLAELTDPVERWNVLSESGRDARYYRFNAQRVDLVDVTD